MDHLKMHAAFYTFMGSAAYICLKHFYFDEIVLALVQCLGLFGYYALMPLTQLSEMVGGAAQIDFWNYYDDVRMF